MGYERLRLGAALAAVALIVTGCGEEAPTALSEPTRYESARFVLYDYSNAPSSLADSMLTRLELEYDRVDAFLPEFPNPQSVVANILPGGGIPFVQLFDATLAHISGLGISADPSWRKGSQSTRPNNSCPAWTP
jgi:hypothetical protein